MTAPVYLSINEFPGDGVTTQFEFNFAGGYISRDHVKAYTTDAVGVITTIDILPAMWVNDYTLDLGVSAPVGGKVRIYRETPRSSPLVNFADGARITEANLDLLARQTVLGVAEAFDAGAYAAVNDLLGSAGQALAAALASQAATAASEAAAATSAIAASAARIAAETAEAAAEAAANDPRVQTVYDNITAIQNAAANAAAAEAAKLDAQSSASTATVQATIAITKASEAAASAAAAATFDPANYVPKTGGSYTGPVGDPLGDLRDIPRIRVLAAGGAIVASDVGGHVVIGAAASLDVAVMAEGEVVMVLNHTSADLTITLTGTAYVSGIDTARTSVTLRKRGMVTILRSDGTLWLSGAVQ